MTPIRMFSILLCSSNCLSFILMYVDKGKAIRNKRRIPEKTFVVLALFGGGLGIILSGLLFRHKTSKASFILKITLAILLNILLIGILVKYTEFGETIKDYLMKII